MCRPPRPWPPRGHASKDRTSLPGLKRIVRTMPREVDGGVDYVELIRTSPKLFFLRKGRERMS